MPFTGGKKTGWATAGAGSGIAGPDSGYFRRLGHRLTADLDQLDAEELELTREEGLDHGVAAPPLAPRARRGSTSRARLTLAR